MPPLSDVNRASDSVGTRDFDAEIKALLAQADAARAQAESIDTDGAMASVLQRTAAAADEAIGRGRDAAEGARAKIHEQQERFKAGVIADGLSLDDEVPGGSSRREAIAEGVEVPSAGNRYALLMDRRKKVQEAERM